MREPAVVRVGSVMLSISNALVALHKEQFGRGPTRARTHYAGTDALLCVMEDALLPAEHALVRMGEGHRVQEARLFFQNASAEKFVAVVEEITGRTVTSFSSCTDPAAAIVCEVYVLEPHLDGAHVDGSG